MHACCVVRDELSIQNSQNVEFPSLSMMMLKQGKFYSNGMDVNYLRKKAMVSFINSFFAVD